MPRPGCNPRVEVDLVLRLWFHRQGLTRARGEEKLTKKRFLAHLEGTGGLQLDSVNVVDRAHYLTLWSRFGTFDRALPDRWTYRDRIAFEHWGHEACVLPASRLPRSLRHMRRFRPQGSWWGEHLPTPAGKRRVLKRLRQEGPLESADFEKSPEGSGPWWGWKEDKRALEVMWHGGRVAVSSRRHFRRAYDLAERVYGDVTPAPLAEYEDGWLFTGLSGNGIATEKHLENYLTAPRLPAADRKRVIARNLRKKRVIEVEVEGRRGTWLALPEDVKRARELPAPRGTTLICPFDSLLWQRRRAEELLDFRYRIEIYVPPAKRVFGYYVLPILHDGRLVGRLDPKLHRDRGELEIKAIHLEPGFRKHAEFKEGLAASVRALAEFLGATSLRLPKGGTQLV